MENLFSYQALVIISVSEFAVIITLLVFLLKNKSLKTWISKIKAKNQERRRQANLKWQARVRELKAQETQIANLVTPIKFVSLTGGTSDGRSVTVEDGNSRTHTFHAYENEYHIAKKFAGLNSSAEHFYYNSKYGEVMFG